jgi:hypothetical protein
MKQYLATLVAAIAPCVCVAADYVYRGPTSYSVAGSFTDNIHFNAPAPSNYTIKASSQRIIVSCSGRYCKSPGTIYGYLTSAQLLTEAGDVVATLPYTSNTLPVCQGVFALPAGGYVLRVTGIGEGTGRYLGIGQYSLSITSPAGPPATRSTPR